MTPQAFLETIKIRRTNYTITDTELPLSEAEIVAIVRQALIDSPSPWNVSSSRAIIVMNQQHKALLNDVVRSKLRITMPEDRQGYFDDNVKGFAAGAGSVLFFEDQNALEKLGEEHPTSKAAIPEWSDASSGMAQFNVWTALSLGGLGCSLQHLTFLPGIEEAIREHLNVPAAWKPKAQLIFGRPTQQAGEKPTPLTNIEERVRILT